MRASPTYFRSAVGLVLAHATARYAELRYLPTPRQPGDLATLLTQLAQLLLARGWHRFLSDNRQRRPYSADEKQWFVRHWLPGVVPSPTPLTGVVLPEQVVARLPFLELSLKAAEGSLRYRTFHELDEALASLRALRAPTCEAATALGGLRGRRAAGEAPAPRRVADRGCAAGACGLPG